MKLIETVFNNSGGVDLITERDSGNIVRILTGKLEYSLDFWERLLELANDTVLRLQYEKELQDRLSVNP